MLAIFGIVAMLSLQGQAETAGVFSLYCKFDWISVKVDGHIKSEATDFELRFLIDTDQQKAYIIGNQGTGEVIMINGLNSVSMLEKTEVGNLMTTTIELKSFEAVHSRHSVSTEGMLPQQFYGQCTSSS